MSVQTVLDLIGLEPSADNIKLCTECTDQVEALFSAEPAALPARARACLQAVQVRPSAWFCLCYHLAAPYFAC